ncbi:outer membrane protein assembly factor BamB family protein [Paenibacillus mendelii]|uniref:PQQ-binding-like beta-propeller repeat protein n=1 Tax=Paenibacillus mendelii TaxID=206163 RepID=A0ABV6JHS6_9BACL|nr:PQQ-binding-like beta-propeller repeat protein [Paenibacillus mendelii]MCQ6558138.1 hypothetical protein [Paenibacillus mendelii]
MRIRLWLILCMALLITSPIAANTASAEASGQDFAAQWVLDEKKLGVAFRYNYSSYRQTTGLFSIPLTNKAGHSYFVVHRSNDIFTNSILCVSPDGKIKWRRDFQANELDVKGNNIHMDEQGNIYYVTTKSSGKTRIRTAYSLSPEGKQRWSYTIPGTSGGWLQLKGDGNAVITTNTKLFVINPSGKVVFSKALPETAGNDNLSFFTANKGKMVYHKYVYQKSSVIGQELHVYGSDNKFLYKISVKTSFGGLGYRQLRFLDNGDALNVQSYVDSANPAVLRLYDAKGKLKWKKVIYSYVSEDDVFVSGRNVYYRTGYRSNTMPHSLHRIDADTGLETAKYTSKFRHFNTFYAGYNQETIYENEPLMQAMGRNDLSSEKDLSLYEIGTNTLKTMDPKTLAITKDYKESLDAFILSYFQAEVYKVVSARNGFAYVYFNDAKTRSYYLARIKLGK